MRSASLIVCLALAFGLAAGTAPAQPGTGGPSPEMKKLEFLAGSLSGKGKMYPPGGQPIDWTSTDRSSWAMGGLFLRTDSKVRYAGMPEQEGLAMISYDPQAKVYRAWAFTPMASQPMEAAGNFEGKKLVLLGKAPHPGSEPVEFRLTFDPKAKSEVDYLLEMKMGSAWQKLEEGRYTARK